MHESSFKFVKRFAPDGPVKILDVGGRDINGTTEGAFDPASDYTACDLYEGPNVDLVGDICDLASALAGQFDVVTCTNVLEHAPNWRDMIAACFTALTDGGLLILTAPGPGWDEHSHHDGGELREGEHYENMTVGGVTAALVAAGFTGIYVEEGDREVLAVAHRP